MKERPIIFSAPMVQALLAGRKTQTRRVIKNDRIQARASDWLRDRWHPVCDVTREYVFTTERGAPEQARARCPFGQPGDRLWVREGWQAFFEDEVPADRPRGPRHTMGIPAQPHRRSFVYYRADGDLTHPELGKAGWLSPIHMPRKCARITLEITGVRVERLNSISEADAIAESVNVHPDHHGKPRDSIYSPIQAFRDLWESIHGLGAWEANPWVWAVAFQRVQADAHQA